MKISKEDLTALRLADRIGIYLRKGAPGGGTGGTAKLRPVQEIPADVFQSRERCRVIEGDGAGFDASLPSWAGSASATLYTGRYNRTVGAIAALLALARPGDELFFRAHNGGNQYVEAATIPPRTLQDHDAGYDHIYQDELTVTLRRGDKDIIRDLVLYVCTCHNNTARMIQN